MSLDYLLPFKANCNFEDLSALKNERNEWMNRKQSIESLQSLKTSPDVQTNYFDFSSSSVTIGKREELTDDQFADLEKAAKNLIPWKKGPFNLFGLEIDAEWRSDKKWERLKGHVGDLKGKTVLDIGCNNGYFMFRMLEDEPKLLLGIDPMPHLLAQFKFLQKYANVSNMELELFGVEHLVHFKNFFDVIFSMGIIYHHRHPIAQLLEIKEALKPGGEVILETIGIPGEESTALFPEDRYAKMKNVWFVPTMSCFVNWAKRAKFVDVEIISDTPLTFEEQRKTKWCPETYQSLEDFLDKDDPTKTIEGHPAPRRFMIKAKKRMN
jgi:tRNA (mo5U34)-methyltransferase